MAQQEIYELIKQASLPPGVPGFVDIFPFLHRNTTFAAYHGGFVCR